MKVLSIIIALLALVIAGVFGFLGWQSNQYFNQNKNANIQKEVGATEVVSPTSRPLEVVAEEYFTPKNGVDTIQAEETVGENQLISRKNNSNDTQVLENMLDEIIALENQGDFKESYLRYVGEAPESLINAVNQSTEIGQDLAMLETQKPQKGFIVYTSEQKDRAFFILKTKPGEGFEDGFVVPRYAAKINEEWIVFAPFFGMPDLDPYQLIYNSTFLSMGEGDVNMYIFSGGSEALIKNFDTAIEQFKNKGRTIFDLVEFSKQLQLQS